MSKQSNNIIKQNNIQISSSKFKNSISKTNILKLLKIDINQLGVSFIDDNKDNAKQIGYSENEFKEVEHIIDSNLPSQEGENAAAVHPYQ